MAEGSKIQTSAGITHMGSKARLNDARNRQRVSKSYKHGQTGPLSQTQPNTQKLPELGQNRADQASTRRSIGGRMQKIKQAARMRKRASSRGGLRGRAISGILASENLASNSEKEKPAFGFSLVGMVAGFFAAIFTGPTSEATKKARSLTLFGLLTSTFKDLSKGPVAINKSKASKLALLSITLSLLMTIGIIALLLAIIMVVLPQASQAI